MFKKFFCKHQYQLLTTYETDVDASLGYDKRNKYIIYCPKCKKELDVLEHEYNKIMAKQRIDGNYEEEGIIKDEEIAEWIERKRDN
jgi:uncharacterized protein YbaR (Trm112 family)